MDRCDVQEAEAGGAHPDDMYHKRIAHRIECEYEQAVHADQLVKLNVFVTTPAIPSFFFNALQEFLGTTVLLVGALMVSERGVAAGGRSDPNAQAVGSIFVGVWVTLITIAFGGPTGPSVNTARDLGPRMVHWMVPIPGKGPSNWWYAPLIAVSNIAGGAMAALLYSLITSLH
jgi:glycerol uptake facilitator protein